MKKKNKVIKFGDDIEGYALPVLNEREIRASAGIMFLVLFLSLMLILFKQDFLLVKYVIVVFLTDFIIRVFISPRLSPVLIIGRLIVSRQVPEYVGAPQKKFAWKIGLALSGLMFFLLVLLNSYSIITGVTCLACLVFLFFESAFGICLGCLVYGLFYKEKARHCAGEVCGTRQKQTIQRIAPAHVLIVVGFVVYVMLAVVLFNDHFRIAPRNLKTIINSR
ncbi:DUF4395 domain-containing protein [Flavisolibacter ginsenosidimutans]|uniref:DUF4395 domain-containing protein n=1 Tax=Flavisolibacter ginsenosidimutans TaxID=661481 RepID=A0A5B8UNA2_9BACT|nr:DUF4395 domain-containing protein [Flavisolibacter ginsenosidimutans]QEC57926.1 DUF4395 domain-containing protein [Flavisolibacter ginsenosidimutans]